MVVGWFDAPSINPSFLPYFTLSYLILFHSKQGFQDQEQEVLRLTAQLSLYHVFISGWFIRLWIQSNWEIKEISHFCYTIFCLSHLEGIFCLTWVSLLLLSSLWSINKSLNSVRTLFASSWDTMTHIEHI